MVLMFTLISGGCTCFVGAMEQLFPIYVVASKNHFNKIKITEGSRESGTGDILELYSEEKPQQRSGA